MNVDDGAWTEGRIGGGLMLDGMDDHVTIVGWKGIGGSRPRTCCAWIKTQDTMGLITGWGMAGGPGRRWLFLVDEQGRLRVEVGGGAIVGSTVISDGRWHHVAAVLEDDGTASVDEVRLYVDGVCEVPSLTAEQAIDTVVNSASSQDVTIGGWPAAATYLKDVLDEVQIYERALTPEQIASMAE